MPLTGHIAADNLMTLEAYARWRPSHLTEIIAHRRLRSVPLGDHMTVQFESETSVRYQIQEMLRIEKIFDPQGIQEEIEAYAPLVPDGHNWKATLLIEYAQPDERKQALSQLIGVEDRLFIEMPGQSRVYAIADEDLDRETPGKTSAVHFLRFEMDAPMRQAILAGQPVTLGCDHAHYQTQTQIADATLANLRLDLQP